MYEVSTGVRSTRSEDGGIVLDINQGKIFRLNGIGALIFERLREGQNTSQITNEISLEFDIPFETIEADIIEFIGSLQKHNLIRGFAQESP